MRVVDVERLLAAELKDAQGRATTLRAQSGPQRTVVVFLRHFG